MEQVIRAAITSIEQVASEIEDTFAIVGDHLGRGHALFQELNTSLFDFSGCLSGADIEGTAAAFQAISERLAGLAATLPAESQLLRKIGASTSQATEALAPLVRHSQMLITIARSARIEAASLDAGGKEGFLDFTKEAAELARLAKESIEVSIVDHRRVLAAVSAAFARQDKFSRGYRSEIASIAEDLKRSHAGLQERQAKSIELARLAGESANDLSDAVGRAIVSLQAGDSARQRAEHVCSGLSMSLSGRYHETPGRASDSAFPSLMAALQTEQLRDTRKNLMAEMAAIDASLAALTARATDELMRGLSLYQGGDEVSASFLADMQDKLKRAATLIGMCDRERQDVEESLTSVETTLRRFRSAITDLSEIVVDITLIGMNAALRAAHLGSKGSAFVVIANELKMAADQIADGAAALKPIVETIKDSAAELRNHRLSSETLAICDFESLTMPVIQQLREQHEKFSSLMGHIEQQGGCFKRMMADSQAHVHQLVDHVGHLDECVEKLGAADQMLVSRGAIELVAIEPRLIEHQSIYTMVREREIYNDFARRMGLSPCFDRNSADTDVLEDMLF